MLSFEIKFAYPVPTLLVIHVQIFCIFYFALCVSFRIWVEDSKAEFGVAKEVVLIE